MNRRDEEAAEGCIYIALFGLFILFVGYIIHAVKDEAPLPAPEPPAKAPH